MARGETGTAITQSVLDRLIDREPDSQAERPPTRPQSVRQLKAAVRRDLEWLLNTRRNPEAAPDAASELVHSLYVYGLPDITSFSLNSTKDQNRLAWLLENAIKEFEPRLKAVRVRMERNAGDGSGSRACYVRYAAGAHQRLVPRKGRVRCVMTCSIITSAN
ncbi:MAG: type VI secretion system baseplate subunit TssE [Bryobacteraceae bacterium]|nr:type VI secretion system baseplate subunit TssE [Bryobacteraceae bacterium]